MRPRQGRRGRYAWIQTSRGFTGDGVDVFHALELFHQARELRERVDLHGRRHDGGFVVIHMHLERGHVHAILGHDRGDIAHETLPVPRLDLDCDRVEMRGVRFPVDRHHARRVLGVDRVDAVDAVHSHALAACRIADDRVARYRLTARSDRGEDSLLPPHQHTRRWLDLGDEWDRAQVAPWCLQVQRHAHDDGMRGQVAIADRRHEVVHRAVLVHAGDLQQLRLRQVGKVEAVHAVQLLSQRGRALGHVLLSALALEPLADALLGRCALDEVQPVAARAVRSPRGQDLHDLPVLQLVVERNHAAVDLGPDAAVADLGVDAVGKVDGRRVRRQGDHVAARREDVDLVLEQVDLDRVQERLGVPHLVLPLQQAAEPRELLVEGRILATFLVSPVRGDAELGHPVHLVRADLDLDRLTGVRDDGGVERLVAVRFRHRDVVLEATRHRVPQGVHHAGHAVAVAHALDLDADGGKVVDLRDLLVLAGHLLPVRVDVLRPAGYLRRLDAHLLQLAGENLAQVFDELLALVALAGDAPDDVFVRLRLEVAEGQVLELPLDLPDAQPVGEWSVDVEGLARDLAALRLGERLERAHVVQAGGGPV